MAPCSHLFETSVPLVRGGGGAIFGLNHKDVYPDALANVVHGYAHLDEEHDEALEANKEVINVSATTKKVSDEDDFEEDPFFRVLLHNNDDDSSVVNVSAKTDERVDNELFEKLHDKLFHHEDEDHAAKEKITYGLREFLEDGVLIE